MLTIGDKAYEHYAKIHLAKMNPDSEEVLKALVKSGFEIIKSTDIDDNLLWYYVVKEVKSDE